MKPDQLAYPAVLTMCSRHLEKGRTESAAFLNWFLESIYRLDDVQADDSICDGPNDKGIDGIYVSDIDRELHLLQSKLYQNNDKTLGDSSLKDFVGSLSQFRTVEAVEALLAGGANAELKKLVERTKFVDRLKAGYSIRGVFVCNNPYDSNAAEYLAQHPDIKLYDRARIATDYVEIDAPEGVQGTAELPFFEGHTLAYQSGPARMFQFVTPAASLVALDGIGDHTLFAQNVRLPLGNTSVNRGIRESLEDRDTHKEFPLFHNGCTLLCRSAHVSEGRDRLTMTDYVVVNGAQTLTTLYRSRDKISSDLRIPVRVIEIADNPELGKKITQISNNQNAIKPQDMRANHYVQERLKTEIERRYGPDYAFLIKRGDNTGAKHQIKNEWAGTLMLAFDLLRPWSCHQVYKIFDEDYGEIFGRPEVTADRVIFLWHVGIVVDEKISSIRHQALSRYRLTRFFLIYVLSRMMRNDAFGERVVRNPSLVTSSDGWILKLSAVLNTVLDSLIIDLNYEVEEAGEGFDYKSELKSPNRVKERADELLKAYEKDVAKGRAPKFEDLWREVRASSEPTAACV